MRHDTHNEGDPSDEELVDALVQTSYAIIGIVTSVAAHHDLSLTLLRVLAILRDRTPTMSQLAHHLGLDRSTVTGLVERAVRRDLLEKLNNPDDRRSNRVGLTEEGRALAETVTQEIKNELKPLSSRLDMGQRYDLTKLLTGLGVVG